MRIKRKVVQQLLLTEQELKALFECAEKARSGQTVNYAEMKMDDGSFFGIGVGEEYKFQEPVRRPSEAMPKLPEPKNGW